jgi:hypothetical protein
MAAGPAAAQESSPNPQPILYVQPVDYVAVITYMRTLPAETLIRIAWSGTGQADRAVAIARRESGLRCDADNPRSSASGLFQTLSLHRARAERLNLTWSNVTGPDCLDDVFLAYDMWSDSGWGPWRM